MLPWSPTAQSNPQHNLSPPQFLSVYHPTKTGRFSKKDHHIKQLRCCSAFICDLGFLLPNLCRTCGSFPVMYFNFSVMVLSPVSILHLHQVNNGRWWMVWIKNKMSSRIHHAFGGFRSFSHRSYRQRRVQVQKNRPITTNAVCSGPNCTADCVKPTE